MNIANELVELCRQGKNKEVLERLFSEDIVSVESAAPQGGGEREVRGLEAVKAKGQHWESDHEIHKAVVEGPWPHGNSKFAVRFCYEVTNKPSNQRFELDEIAVYTVESGKIVREEFFYPHA